MQSAQLFSGGLQIAGKQSSNVIQRPAKSYLIFYHVAKLWKWNCHGFRNKVFWKKNSSTKTNKALFAVDIQISCNGNFIDIAFWHRYLTLSKLLTLASFAISFVSFYAFAAVFSLFVNALSTNWST